MTTRGFTTKDFEKAAHYIDRAVKIAKQVKDAVAAKGDKTKISEFRQHVEGSKELEQLKQEVVDWVKVFPVPGEHA